MRPRVCPNETGKRKKGVLISNSSSWEASQPLPKLRSDQRSKVYYIRSEPNAKKRLPDHKSRALPQQQFTETSALN